MTSNKQNYLDVYYYDIRIQTFGGGNEIVEKQSFRYQTPGNHGCLIATHASYKMTNAAQFFSVLDGAS